MSIFTKALVASLVVVRGVVVVINARSVEDEGVTLDDLESLYENEAYEKAIFAGGCFWCIEPPYAQLDGVVLVVPGYSGGHTSNPTYNEVMSGTTGHAEGVQIMFDPQIISYGELLDVFWRQIDPTSYFKSELKLEAN